MSVRAIDAVLRLSKSETATRLVAVVIADVAHHDGVGWLDQREVATRANVSVPSVKRGVAWLVEHGELEVRKVQRGRRRVNVYRVLLGEVAEQPVEYDRLPFDVDPPFSTRDQIDTPSLADEGSPTTPTRDHPRARVEDPPLEPPEASSSDDARGETSSRRRDSVWDGLAAIFGEPTTKTEKTHRGKIVREVREAIRAEFAAVPTVDNPQGVFDDFAFVETLLQRRVSALRTHWRGEADVTQDALVKHWTLAYRLSTTGRATQPVSSREKSARWVERVGVRFEDERDVRGFLTELADGDQTLVDEMVDEWKRRREASDGEAA